MKLWVLGSGSRGNAIVLESAGTRVLIDAGFPPPVMAERLSAINIAPESIEALLVTHEHKDHMRGARVCAEKYGWAVHASAGTVVLSRDITLSGAKPFRAGTVLQLGDFEINTVRAPHDAAEHVVVVATSRTTGARAGIAYDLGCITDPILETLTDLDLLVLEANHDEEMLRTGPYPPTLQKRIAGRKGHLSNRLAGKIARKVTHKSLKHIILAHLSEVCNTPDLAIQTVKEALPPTRFRGMITAAQQDVVIGPFIPGSRPAKQLELAL
jgi:phosphoribosyl 1,2-cyclic phosphodiesterase